MERDPKLKPKKREKRKRKEGKSELGSKKN